MSRFTFNRGEILDAELLCWLQSDIKIKELKKQKTIHQLLDENIIPNFNDFISAIDSELVSYMLRRNYINDNLDLMRAGEGYVAGIIISLDLTQGWNNN